MAEQAQGGGPDQHAGDDLADDGGDAYALGAFGGDLGGHQHDDQVSQDLGEVHVGSGLRAPERVVDEPPPAPARVG